MYCIYEYCEGDCNFNFQYRSCLWSLKLATYIRLETILIDTMYTNNISSQWYMYHLRESILLILLQVVIANSYIVISLKFYKYIFWITNSFFCLFVFLFFWLFFVTHDVMKLWFILLILSNNIAFGTFFKMLSTSCMLSKETR